MCVFIPHTYTSPPPQTDGVDGSTVMICIPTANWVHVCVFESKLEKERTREREREMKRDR